MSTAGIGPTGPQEEIIESDAPKAVEVAEAVRRNIPVGRISLDDIGAGDHSLVFTTMSGKPDIAVGPYNIMGEPRWYDVCVTDLDDLADSKGMTDIDEIVHMVRSVYAPCEWCNGGFKRHECKSCAGTGSQLRPTTYGVIAAYDEKIRVNFSVQWDTIAAVGFDDTGEAWGEVVDTAAEIGYFTADEIENGGSDSLTSALASHFARYQDRLRAEVAAR